MPFFQKKVTVAANDVIDNVLTGSQWEFVQPAAVNVQFGIVASATGMKVDVYSGPDTLAEDIEPSEQNRFPIFPDDYTLTDVAMQNDRLKVRGRNTTAGPLDLFVGLKIDEVA